MTLAELNTVLATTNLPVAYQAFPADKVPAMPFIVYMELGSDNFGADNVVWHSAARVEIDLLCKTKDGALESVLETVLTNAGIFWERESDHNDDEDCYVTTYNIEI